MPARELRSDALSAQRACRSGRSACRRRRSRACPPCRPRTRSRSPWSARISPACRSTANCTGSAGATWSDRNGAGLSALRACRRPSRQSPACCGLRPARAPPSRWRSGRCRRRLRPLCRRDIASARDRHPAARRRPHRQGLSGGGGAVAGAPDISAFGGWRSYLRRRRKPSRTSPIVRPRPRTGTFGR